MTEDPIMPLPVFDTMTLQGHLLGVAEHLRTLGSAKDLSQCADIIVRVAQAMDGQGTRLNHSDFAAELSALIGSNSQYQSVLHPDLSPAIAANTAQIRLLDAAALETYLRTHAIIDASTRINNATMLSGGRCKLTALIEIENANTLPATFILRQDWNGGATNTSVANEYELLSLLADEGLLVPRPYHIEPRPNGVGLPFILMEHMPGKLEAGLFEPPPFATLAMQLANQLAKLHRIDVTKARKIGLKEPGDVSARAATIASFRADHAAFGIGSAIIDAALDWLDANSDSFGTSIAIVHNDLGFHNALTDGDRLTALLDWELCEIGHPAADLGYIKHFVEQMMPWPEFLKAYRDAGGWDGPDAELRFHTIWNGVRLYGLIMRARAAIAAGQVRDVEISHACADNLILLLIFIGQELSAALNE